MKFSWMNFDPLFLYEILCVSEIADEKKDADRVCI